MTAAILVAHGAPSDPDPQEAALSRLASRVNALLPDWQISGATLAKQGALTAALARHPNAVIYPFFMAQGWFTTREMPKRLAAAGYSHLTQLDPFGTDPDLPALMADLATQGAADAGLIPAASTLLLAAHGSKVSRTSADSTWAMAEEMRARTGFAKILCGFVEEAPFLADVAKDIGPAICLPFFALRAGHVSGDVPDALRDADFQGVLLPAVGEHESAARLIAQALRRGAAG